MSRSSALRVGTVQRARIVLLASDGVANAEIARRVGVARQTVIDWRERYRVEGIAGLDDAPRSGRPRVIDDAAVVVETLQPAQARRDALVRAAVGRSLGDFVRVGGADLAGMEAAALAP